jgi:hypothetical protein
MVVWIADFDSSDRVELRGETSHQDGSVKLSFGLLSILGLRSPLKFTPVLLLELSYKVIWFIGVILPIVVTAKFPSCALVYVIIFATFIIGDLIAIPFSCVFAKQTDR